MTQDDFLLLKNKLLLLKNKDLEEILLKLGYKYSINILNRKIINSYINNLSLSDFLKLIDDNKLDINKIILEINSY